MAVARVFVCEGVKNKNRRLGYQVRRSVLMDSTFPRYRPRRGGNGYAK
jgi:hypothetical protein